MHRAFSFLFLLMSVLAFGCAGKTTRPASVAQPDLYAQLVNPLFFGSSTQASANIEVRVQNRAQVPITLRRIEIDTPTMGQYQIVKKIERYNDVIEPGQTKSVTLFATAVALTTRRPSEPLSVRAIVEFKAGNAVWREILLMRN